MVQFTVSSEQRPEQNVDRDQVHLVVTATELDIIADALRTVGNMEFADRIETILRQLGQAARRERDA